MSDNSKVLPKCFCHNGFLYSASDNLALAEATCNFVQMKSALTNSSDKLPCNASPKARLLLQFAFTFASSLTSNSISGNFVPTFRDNLSVPTSGLTWTLRMGPIGCPKTSVGNYHYSLRNNPEERSSQRIRLLKIFHQKIYFGFRVAWKRGTRLLNLLGLLLQGFLPALLSTIRNLYVTPYVVFKTTKTKQNNNSVGESFRFTHASGSSKQAWHIPDAAYSF